MKGSLFLSLLIAGTCLASTQDSATLSLIVKPEVLLTSAPGTANLKIRLSEGASAQMWMAESCSLPPAAASVVTVSKSGQMNVSSEGVAAPSFAISRSGAYQVQLNSLSGSGNTVCLQSTDGLTAQTSVK